ncbi:MAG: nucleoside triphosphate pyrophosphohydrolase [Elainellaceae cyanobacterium]
MSSQPSSQPPSQPSSPQSASSNSALTSNQPPSAHEPKNEAEPIEQSLEALQSLIEIVAKLRSPDGGCPWDLAQTPESLMPCVIEEAYEVVDAIRQGDRHQIVDELGDLLLQVVLQAQVAQDQGQFFLKDVAEAIAQKLVRRHPHVFGSTQVSSTDEVRANWEEIKAAEDRGDLSGDLSGNGSGEAVSPALGEARLTPRLQKYVRSLPPLMASLKVSKKAAKAGFEWDSVEEVWEKFHEELDEFHRAVESESKARQQSELGDLLLTLVSIARWHGLDPAEALQSTNRRFIDRFAHVEDAAGRSLADFSPEELEELWRKAKADLAAQEKSQEQQQFKE